jgi:hypothetical protein
VIEETYREELARRESHTPEWTTAIVRDFHLGLDAHGRKTPSGHRCAVTTQQARDALVEVLRGGYGPGIQQVAYRLVQGFKPKPLNKWRAAAQQLLADWVQLQDPKVSRDRAQRIGEPSNAEVQLLVEWLDTTAESGRKVARK